MVIPLVVVVENEGTRFNIFDASCLNWTLPRLASLIMQTQNGKTRRGDIPAQRKMTHLKVHQHVLAF
ncbi:hypothetical protein F383_16060 [Gossypium arboreum]|uniref:Uncharacterized protein n=1 Tax=Gossypium arboreum TaxID=29729 RepID=A0A0B0NCK0_GOSAR|nr:hypothetical protein F383_16060 [Gossypium arboreum]